MPPFSNAVFRGLLGGGGGGERATAAIAAACAHRELRGLLGRPHLEQGALACARAAALDAATWDRRQYTLPPRVASARLGPAERARWRLQVPTVRRQAAGVLGPGSAALPLWASGFDALAA